MANPGRKAGINHFPVREFRNRRNNPYQGISAFSGTLEKPFSHKGSALSRWPKVGGFGHGFFNLQWKGCCLKSESLFAVADPRKGHMGKPSPREILAWEPLKMAGRSAAEHSYSVLSDGSFFVVYRSRTGIPVYSLQAGIRGKPGSAAVKNEVCRWPVDEASPGELILPWKCENGKFLNWFHNQWR